MICVSCTEISASAGENIHKCGAVRSLSSRHFAIVPCSMRITKLDLRRGKRLQGNSSLAFMEQFLPEVEFLALENVLPTRNRRGTTRAPPPDRRERLRHVSSPLARASINRRQNMARSGRRAEAAPCLFEPLARVINLLVRPATSASHRSRHAKFAVRAEFSTSIRAAAAPIRAEFFGDDIESLREFDLDTQPRAQLNESSSCWTRPTIRVGGCAITSIRGI